MRSAAVSTVFLVASSVASAQETGGWLIRTGEPVSPSNPLTTVEVWAWFDDPTGERDVFAWGDFDFVAQDGTFRDPTVRIAAYLGAPAPLPGTAAGSVVDTRVEGVLVGQRLPGAGIASADPANPILVWSAEWGTHDFAPRSVDLSTEGTNNFVIGHNSWNWNFLHLYPGGFQLGSGVIQVIPAPPAAAPLVAIILFGTRRRRR